MKKATAIKRDRVRMFLFFGMSMVSIVMLYMLLLNGPDNRSPRVQDAWAYLVIGNVMFMGISVICTLARSLYIGKSYDMEHLWLFPTVGFNEKSMYIIWLRFEIFVTW